jgi:hypothetical protein
VKDLYGGRFKMSKQIISTISPLFGGCRPSAVIGRISTVVIDTINRVFRARLASHIREEIREGISSSPPIADGYSSASPIIESPILRIEASISEPRPSPIFRTRSIVGVFSVAKMGKAALEPCKVLFRYRPRLSDVNSFGHDAMITRFIRKQI